MNFIIFLKYLDSEPIFSAPALVVHLHTLQSTVLYWKTEKLSNFVIYICGRMDNTYIPNFEMGLQPLCVF